MKGYQILEHTADLKIKAFGKTKKELFLNMLKGMASALRAKTKNKKQKTKKIKIKSLNLETLLVDFLNEVLYLSQVNREIYNNIEFKKFADNQMEGNLIGYKVKRFGEDIKAATYHNLKISRKKDKIWETTVLFDI